MNRSHRFLFATLTTLGLSAVACGGWRCPPIGSPPATASDRLPPAIARERRQGTRRRSSDGVADNRSLRARCKHGRRRRAAGSAPRRHAGRLGASKDVARGPARRQEERSVAPEPTNRPGLGTEWGETRFVAHHHRPLRPRRRSTRPSRRRRSSTTTRRARAPWRLERGFRRTPSGSFTIAHGAVTVGLRDEGGRSSAASSAGGNDFVVGEAGQRYTIVLKNNTDLRFEVRDARSTAST